MKQRLEILPAKLFSKVITASIEIGGSIQSALLTFPSFVDGSPDSEALTGVTVECGFDDLGSGNTTLLEMVASRYIPYVKITATAAVNVQRIKFESSAASTLNYDPVQKRVNEITAALRYYEDSNVVVFSGASTAYCYGFNYRAQKRTAAPVVTKVTMLNIDTGGPVTTVNFNSVSNTGVGSVVATVAANAAYILRVTISSEL
jgi:hypothetical protein